MTQVIHFVRHGEVDNPEKILYGLQPGWKLSERGLQMAEVIANWSKDKNLGAIHASPLQRAQETVAPIIKAHQIHLTTDKNLIEAGNIFEGKRFELGSGVLKHPKSWRYLYNPWRPSWGEPYDQIINRMLKALFAARDAAGTKDAICVSHQLPIWILRRAVEGKRLIHDPRKRECTLASVTSFELDHEGMVSSVSYSEPAKHLLPKK
jgi:broad specificity phosphatase PhoE